MNIPSTITAIPRRKTPFFLVFVLQLVACSLWGQVLQKKPLTSKDYSKWADTYSDKISPDAKWVSYSTYYQNGTDTLFIRNVKSLKTYSFASADQGFFITPVYFIFKSEKGLHVLNLDNGGQRIIPGVLQHVYSQTSGKLLILVGGKAKQDTLLIKDPQGIKEQRIAGVNEFVMDPTGRNVLFSAGNGADHSVNILELSGKKQTKVLYSGPAPFSNLVWQKQAKALAFTQKLPDDPLGSTLYFYNLATNKLFFSLRSNLDKFLSDSLLIPTVSYQLKISDDMQRVFFGLQRRAQDSAKTDAVQLWNANAKWIYTTEQQQKPFQGNYLGLWYPEQDHYRLISDDTLPQFMLTGDQKHAIISNTKQYEPQYVREGPRDYYLLDLASGKKELFLKKHSDSFLLTIPSPDGKRIAYFKEKNWWIYDISQKTHTNITKNIGASFLHYIVPNDDEAYENLGWTLKGDQILLCDQYDIWAISNDGLSYRRLTHGREIQTRFKLAGYSRIILGKLNYDGWILDPVDLDKGLLLQASDINGGKGFYKWSSKSNDKLIYSSSTSLSQIAQATSDGTFIYMEQSYDLPPRLMVKTPGDKNPKIILQSNLQHQQFHWGGEELISYTNEKGIALKGILYYPAQYDSQKKYPMIVNVYETFSQFLHTYIKPTEFDAAGFNISTYTTQGYFVLLPDISYQVGDPGISAADCVVAATRSIIARGLVQADRIGIIGHSFGGYEASFIITQTSIFKAAVAGAPITDLNSHYLSVGLFGKPQMWRFESHNFRMGKSLFEDRKGYRRNSPIEHVQHCNTPLLLWSGGQDDNVEPQQSMEFYLALRRLEKKNIMLIYPKEGHDIENSKNQKDLSERIHQWFDYHLKDETAPEWIEKGLK
ncbi:S9 family peptidase [Flavobacterium bizetiae]|uniref:S9 family peptidase n=1 Tax=Flavobacterium bizetiae TaxID=2704140 RepID=UPI003757B218